MEMLVSTDWLERELGSRDLAILDASAHLPAAQRNPREEFLDVHIPGARFLDLLTLTDDQSEVPSALPTREQLTQRLRSLGVKAGDRIVFYDDSIVKTSARAWFMLRHHGYEKVAILDGGLGKWRAEDRPLESGAVACEPGDISLGKTSSKVRSKADILANIETAREQLVDARDVGRFTGETEDTVHNLPSGHIPGSCHLFFADLFRDDGTFLPPDQLAGRFKAAGADPAQPIVTTCGSGVTASVLLFALALIGREGALYDGSWSEWGADPETPKATGPATAG